MGLNWAHLKNSTFDLEWKLYSFCIKLLLTYSRFSQIDFLDNIGIDINLIDLMSKC
jgi:hypothetical protein